MFISEQARVDSSFIRSLARSLSHCLSCFHTHSQNKNININ